MSLFPFPGEHPWEPCYSWNYLWRSDPFVPVSLASGGWHKIFRAIILVARRFADERKENPTPKSRNRESTESECGCTPPCHYSAGYRSKTELPALGELNTTERRLGGVSPLKIHAAILQGKRLLKLQHLQESLMGRGRAGASSTLVYTYTRRVDSIPDVWYIYTHRSGTHIARTHRGTLHYRDTVPLVWKLVRRRTKVRLFHTTKNGPGMDIFFVAIFLHYNRYLLEHNDLFKKLNNVYVRKCFWFYCSSLRSRQFLEILKNTIIIYSESISFFNIFN